MSMPVPVRYRNKGTQSGTGMPRFLTDIQDAGMPMPAALDLMQMPSYGKMLHIPSLTTAPVEF